MRSMTDHPARPADARPASPDPGRGPSPWSAERLHPLTRYQIADRLPELCALYAATRGVRTWQEDRRSHDFRQRLTADIRRPGFGLLVAENTSITACAYGFPLRAGMFEIREIVVPPQVRQLSPQREWNLARRLQKRLLVDHGHTTGITLVPRTDVWTVEALRSWGWRDAPGTPYGTTLWPPRHVLLLSV
ncbi:hypothetical protein [Streptomyces sp. N35]|uniref:hypothetical protein n=1 Tax=Streptomyces sp. N35 TaxID=2795730 RepID=UPI0018F76D96|nr:hypothetical protein [Streptomyces sp. N35]